MKNKIYLLLIIIGLLSNFNSTLAESNKYSQTVLGNSDEEIISIDQDEICLVPCDDIKNGGPGKDGIPSVDDPKFISISEADKVMLESERVIGIVINGEARAYPYDILNWHEIVNDVFEGIHTSVTYCPLTGSGILYKVENIGNAQMGVSGKLYENNLIMYDRNTDTYYSQMLGVGIKGVDIENKLERAITIETTYKVWKEMYPDSEILSRDTGMNRDYDGYPYGSYKSDESIYFKSSYVINKLDYIPYHPKTLTVIFEIAGITQLMTFGELTLDPAFEIDDHVLFSDLNGKITMVFERTLGDGTKLTFAKSNETTAFGVFAFEDLETGSTWNILGNAIDGELKGEQLTQIFSYNAYWFAAAAFFGQDAVIHIVGSERYSLDSLDPNEQSEESETSLFFPAVLLSMATLVIIRKR